MSNSNLTPEQRQDKNGKTTTRWVRKDTSPARSLLPSVKLVVIPPTRQQKDDQKARDKRIRHMNQRGLTGYRTSEYAMYPSEKLSHLFMDRYSVSLSDNDVYALLEKMSVSDALVLAANDVTPDKITPKILKLVNREDNTGLVKQLRERGVRFADYASVSLRESSLDYTQEQRVDAAEILSMFTGSQYDGTFGAREVYSDYLLQDQIKLSDLKEIGVDYCGDTNTFPMLLLRINNGKSKCTAAELGAMLDRTKNLHTEGLRQYEINSVINDRADLAVAYGVELAEKAVNPIFINYAVDVLNQTGEHSKEEKLAFCEYVNDVCPEPFNGDRVGWRNKVTLLTEIFDAGVAPDKARDAMAAGLTASQMIAIHSEGIAPSVAGGWL